MPPKFVVHFHYNSFSEEKTVITLRIEEILIYTLPPHLCIILNRYTQFEELQWTLSKLIKGKPFFITWNQKSVLQAMIYLQLKNLNSKSLCQNVTSPKAR